MSINRQVDSYTWRCHTGTTTEREKGVNYEHTRDYEYAVHNVLGPKHYVEQKKPDAGVHAG